MNDIQLSEKFLLDAGGWQAMKHARALEQMGRVLSASWIPPLLKGFVQEGDREYRAGLKIASRTDIENLCTCQESRRFGTLCAHSLAVGLHYLKPRTPEAPPPVTPRKKEDTAPVRGQADPLARFSTDDIPGAMPAKVHVVFPPNFAEAAGKGAVMVGFELETGGKRTLLSAIPEGRRFKLSESDLKLAETAAALGKTKLAGAIQLDGKGVELVLQAGRGNPNITLARRLKLGIDAEPLRPKLKVNRAGEGGLELQCEPPSGRLLLLPQSVWWFKSADALVEIAPGLPLPYRVLLDGRLVAIAADAADAFRAQELPVLGESFVLEGDVGSVAAVAPGFSLDAKVTMEGSFNHLTATTEFRRVPGDAGNFRSEREAAQSLQQAGFTQSNAGTWILKGQQAILNFLGAHLPKLRSKWEVQLGPRFAHLTAGIAPVRPKIEIRGSGTDWFSLEVGFTDPDGNKVPPADVQRLLQMGQFHLRTKSGKMAVFDPHAIEELQQTLAQCDPQQVAPGEFRVGRAYAPFLAETVEALDVAGSKSWRSWLSSEGSLRKPRPADLGNLESVLRPYQKAGFEWFRLLAENGFGGVLADDMGLGKTLQTLAFLRELKGRALVVCPSSLVFNWRAEAERFTPDRKVLVIEGSNRGSLFKQIPEHDLIITSYALLRRDVDRYREHEFTAAILDEAHHIKNPETQNARSASRLKCRHRFVLTGTPVENSPRDLWSLMQFVMPGYLGSREAFAERTEKPIAAGGVEGEAARQRLARRIRPFLLRRMKRDVAPELPERIEQVSYCRLSPLQEDVYKKILEEARAKVQDATRTGGAGQVRMTMLAALTRLRQACCDLRLLGDVADADLEQISAKGALFDELLQEAIDGGHRVLVFSQFVRLLRLLETRLKESGLEYCYLDGETRDRQGVVGRFQKDEKIPVFLISLKAGGVGLNLTGADTVIHFDPWWNPAVEAQATDRAHRIGQTRVVTAYKLITRGTVEERMLELQEKKKQMIGDIIEGTGTGEGGLTLEEMQSLFE